MNQNYQIYQLYSQLTGGKGISDALHAFQDLTIASPSDGDQYFESFGVGHTINTILQPYERFTCYEFLLQELKKADRDKFDQIHKGTPYYFLAWTSFDIGNYEKAVFYLDSAFSEDLRKSRSLGESDPVSAAFNNPGGWLLRLNPDKSGPAARVTARLKDSVENILTILKVTYGLDIILSDLIDKFIVEFVKQNDDNRSVVTAFYSFIYEFDDLYRLLSIRTQDLGSIEPLLVHLFKGGLIFETLLKYVGEKHSFITDLDTNPRKRSDTVSTIGSFNYSSRFISRYCKFDIPQENLEDLVTVSQASKEDAFGVTYKLRNITGHDLRRKDVFQDPNAYKILFEQEIAAILYLIKKEFM